MVVRHFQSMYVSPSRLQQSFCLYKVSCEQLHRHLSPSVYSLQRRVHSRIARLCNIYMSAMERKNSCQECIVSHSFPSGLTLWVLLAFSCATFSPNATSCVAWGDDDGSWILTDGCAMMAAAASAGSRLLLWPAFACFDPAPIIETNTFIPFCISALSVRRAIANYKFLQSKSVLSFLSVGTQQNERLVSCALALGVLLSLGLCTVAAMQRYDLCVTCNITRGSEWHHSGAL